MKTTKSQESTVKRNKKRDTSGKVEANKHLKKAEKLREKLKAAEAKAAKAMIKDRSNKDTKRHCGDVKSSSPEMPCIKEDVETIQDEKSSHLNSQQSINKPNLGLDYSSTSSSASTSMSSTRENSPSSSSSPSPSPDISDSSSSVSACVSLLSSPSRLPASICDTAHPAPSGHTDKINSSVPNNSENKLKATKETKQDQNANQKNPISNHNSKKRPCKFFLKSGRCRNGEKCKFSHDITPRQRKGQDQNQNQNQNRRHPNQRAREDQSGGKYITLSERVCSIVYSTKYSHFCNMF